MNSACIWREVSCEESLHQEWVKLLDKKSCLALFLIVQIMQSLAEVMNRVIPATLCALHIQLRAFRIALSGFTFLEGGIIPLIIVSAVWSDNIYCVTGACRITKGKCRIETKWRMRWKCEGIIKVFTSLCFALAALVKAKPFIYLTTRKDMSRWI